MRDLQFGLKGIEMNSINGVRDVTPYKTESVDPRSNSATDTSVQARRNELAPTLTVQIDQATQRPIPPRFPWLSRLTAELEAAAKQRPTFPPTASLGNNIDKTA